MERDRALKHFPRILRYLRPYWGLAIAVVAVIALCSAADLLSPWPLKILLDSAIGNEPAPVWIGILVSPTDRHQILIFAVQPRRAKIKI